MKKNMFFAFGLWSLLLTSCVSKGVQDAANAAAESVYAGSFKVGNGVGTGPDTKKYKNLYLSLMNFDDRIKDYQDEDLTSIAALTFYNKMQPEDYDGFDKIKVTIERNSTKFEMLYDIKDLSEALKYFTVTASFINSIKEQSETSMQSYLDTTMIPKNNLNEMLKAINQLDSTKSMINLETFLGFKFTSLEESNTPVILTKAVVRVDSFITQFNMTIDRSTEKIVGINVSEF